MDRNQAIEKLIAYALEKQLIQPEEKNWAVNTLLEMLELDGCALPEIPVGEQIDLPAVLDALLDDAYERGVLKESSIVYRDLFDTRLMGALTPRPAQVIEKFNTLYRQSPKEATDWYYQFSQDTNYIRRDRIATRRAVEDDDRIRRAGHHHQPVQAGKGPEGDRRRPQPARLQLSPLPAVRGERGLCRTGQPSGPPEPPHRADHHQRLAVVPAVFALCLLQRALHLPQPRARPDEDRPRLLWQAARLCAAVSALLCRLQRRPADCRRLDLGPRPLPGRPLHLRDGEGPGGDAGLLCRL